MYINKYIYTRQLTEATLGGCCPFHILEKVALFQCVYVHIILTVYILIRATNSRLPKMIGLFYKRAL